MPNRSPVIVTADTRITLEPVLLTIREIDLLLPICVSGFPAEITPELADALSTLVCLSINPLRGRGFPAPSVRRD